MCIYVFEDSKLSFHKHGLVFYKNLKSINMYVCDDDVYMLYVNVCMCIYVYVRYAKQDEEIKKFCQQYVFICSVYVSYLSVSLSISACMYVPCLLYLST